MLYLSTFEWGSPWILFIYFSLKTQREGSVCKQLTARVRVFPVLFIVKLAKDHQERSAQKGFPSYRKWKAFREITQSNVQYVDESIDMQHHWV